MHCPNKSHFAYLSNAAIRFHRPYFPSNFCKQLLHLLLQSLIENSGTTIAKQHLAKTKIIKKISRNTEVLVYYHLRKNRSLSILASNKINENRKENFKKSRSLSILASIISSLKIGQLNGTSVLMVKK